LAAFEDIEAHYGRFAREVVAGHPELNQGDRLPPDIRRQLRANKMFGLCLPESCGGQGGNARTLVGAARALVSESGNIGIALSWLLHETISYWLIYRFADERQKTELLPDLAAGRITVSLAVSEPEIGAHPKHLQTEACPENGLWRLNGKKCHITNGPMADWFIILAKTGKSGDRNLFTAFLVPWDAAGLTVAPATALPFLRPCPHAEISLQDCRIDGARVLGPLDRAFTEMAVLFRRVEDVLMASLIHGGLYYELNWLANMAGPYPDALNEDFLYPLGWLKCSIDAMAPLIEKNAEFLDQKMEARKPAPLSLFLRTQADTFQNRFKTLAANVLTEAELNGLALIRDIDALLGIGRQAAQNRIIRAGRELLTPV